MNNDLFTYFLHAGISLAIFYSLYWLFLRKEKVFRFNRYYLVSSVVLSYVLPMVDFSRLFSNEVAATLPGTIVQNLFVPDNTAPVVMEMNTGFVPQSRLNPYGYLFYVYLFIVFVLLVRMIAGIVKLYIMWKKGSKNKMGDYTIVYTKDNIAPFSFFSFIFLNEDNVSKNNINEIIAHERTHINQYHTLDALFLNIVTIVQWYNPFIWLIKRALKETHEFLADEKVIAQGFDSATYSELLIKQIAGAKAMDFANCFNHLLIKKRLIMLKKLKPGKLALLRIVAVTILTFVIAVSVNVRGQISNSSQSQKAEKTKTYTADGKVQEDKIHSAPNSYKYEELSYCAQKAEKIIAKYAIISKEEKFDSTYIYLVSTFVDFSSGKLDVELQKIIPMKKGETEFKEPPISISILNYNDIKAKFPVVSAGTLKRYIKEQNVEKKKYCLIGTGMSFRLFRKMLPNNTEYWKTHN